MRSCHAVSRIGTSSANAPSNELVARVEACELEAVELLLKCLYKVDMNQEARGNGRLMLQVRKLEGMASDL